MRDQIGVKQDIVSSVIAQATVRAKLGIPVVALMLLSIWYWGSPLGNAGYMGTIFIAVLHILYIAIAFSCSKTKRPEISERIIAATSILDPLILSGWLAMMGESGGLFICFYLFTILGFGFRIGPRPMWICQAVAILGFIAVVLIAPTWRQHPITSFSFLMLLIVVPMYATGLIKKLRDARAYAESESQAKSQLLANVSHELRTPLTGIVMTAQLISSETQDASITKRADTILRLSNDLVIEINDLLDSAKYQANSLVLDASLFDLTDVLEQVRITLSTAASIKDIDFTVSMDTGIQDQVIGDAHYLGRVLLNIAGNAVKFTEKGQVDVRLKLLTGDRNSYRIRFSVQDTGIGIPKDFHTKIFEPFIQASAGTTRKYGGTGLGMSIANELVKMMGGEIILESEPGKGSLFFFELNFLKGTQPAEKKLKAENVPIIYGKRILVADDNATNLLLIKELLQRDRHSVMTATSGQIAIDLLAATAFDLIFLDFNMGDMDGATVLHIYRFGKINPAPTIFLTADTTERTADILKKSGAAGVLHKPITGDGVRTAISKVFISEADNAQPLAPTTQSLSLKPVPSQYIDSAAIEYLKEVCSRPEFIAEILSTAVEDIEKNCNNLLEALEVEDIETVRERAHALKGVSMSVGALRLVSLSSKLMAVGHHELSLTKRRSKTDINEACAGSIASLRALLREQPETH